VVALVCKCNGSKSQRLGSIDVVMTDAVTAATNATTNLRTRRVAASGMSEQANHVACAG